MLTHFSEATHESGFVLASESLSFSSVKIPYLDTDVDTSDIYIKHSKSCYSLQQLGLMKPLASDCNSDRSLVVRPLHCSENVPQVQ